MSSNFFLLLLDYYGIKIRSKVSGNILKEDKMKYTYGKIVNIYRL